ncbi:KaiC domain-containing protein [Halorubrum depositum]|uniref:KaiC domain-containing protein n=1 Tax=Halorubrum depositum TaxID=2583992 RepID=UPI0011A26144|nr:KaiC domain-containing protein [Halorubrum depositum]
MSEEDDWFERALRDLDEESDGSTDGESADARADNGEGVGDGPGNDRASDRGGEEDDPFGGVRDGTDETGQTDGTGGPAPEDGDDGAESDPFGAGSFGAGSFGDDDPFGGRGSGETDSSGEPTGGDFGGGDFGGSDFDGGSDGSDGGPFGGGSFGEDDPFGGYRNRAQGGSDDLGSDDFGFGDFGGGGDGTEPGFDVDPDEFESSIERTDVGIEGLDEMILGGVPSRSLLSVIGGAGTGKTTFALQFLNEALESDRKGIYITLEQTRESIFSTAEEKGWSFREHADEDRLAVVAIDPIEMANSLASIRNDLVRLIAEFDADRLVLDSVSLLEMMYDHPAKRRSEVFGFTRSLKEAGVTTLLTSEANQETPYASRHGIVEYLTDAVFVLQYVRGSDFRETRLAVEIQKIRDANHSRETKPYEITDTGISVYGQANIF